MPVRAREADVICCRQPIVAELQSRVMTTVTTAPQPVVETPWVAEPRRQPGTDFRALASKPVTIPVSCSGPAAVDSCCLGSPLHGSMSAGK